MKGVPVEEELTVVHPCHSDIVASGEGQDAREGI